MSRGHQRASLVPVSLPLSADELSCLVSVSDFHQRSMGVMRHVVRLTSSSEMRDRLRFVDEESKVLRAFAQAMRARAQGRNDDDTDVEFTLRAVIAFWGRLLASTLSTRSRRRLSAQEAERREVLAAKLEAAIRTRYESEPAPVEREIDTRRPVEQTWMRQRLEARPDAPRTHLQ
jgi:hypothetical protein